MTLRMKLDDNPYSLSQDELMSLKNNDRLNNKLECLLKDAFIKKALVQVATSKLGPPIALTTQTSILRRLADPKLLHDL